MRTESALEAIKRLRDLNAIPKTGFALDLGAGTGTDAFALTQMGYQVTAIEKDPLFADGIRKQHPEIEVFEQDMRHFLIGRESYAIISAQYSLPFLVTAQDVFSLLDVIAEGLAPGGAMLFNVFGLKDPWVTEKPADVAFFEYGEITEWLQKLPLATIWESRFLGYETRRSGGGKLWEIFSFTCLKRPLSEEVYHRIGVS